MLRIARHAAVLALIAAAAVIPCSAQACRPAVITAYAAETYPGRTASGVYTWPSVGGIVAGGGAYELGQTVSIEGLGSYTVADRGLGLGWTQIDLLVETHAEAVQWGRQVRTVCG